jgi:hypothetical protein
MRIFRSGVAKTARLLPVGLMFLGLAPAQIPQEADRAIVSPKPEAPATWELKRGNEVGRPGRAVWIASIAALAAANVADAHTSWNKSEGNGILAGSNGSFGAKGAAIKGGVNGLWVVGQVIWLRKNSRYHTLAFVNFAAASLFGALAYRNQGISPNQGVH